MEKSEKAFVKYKQILQKLYKVTKTALRIYKDEELSNIVNSYVVIIKSYLKKTRSDNAPNVSAIESKNSIVVQPITSILDVHVGIRHLNEMIPQKSHCYIYMMMNIMTM